MTQIRVIAGKYGGRKIEAPDFSNSRTKPMGERIRNAMFNRIADEIDGARVLDAFAGTGAVGFEALSRGAARVTFVERDKIAQKILAKNIASLGVEDESEIIRTTVNNWLETMEPQNYDIILADPPYHDLQLSTVFKLMALLKPNGLMVLSYQGSGEVPTELGVVVVDSRSYGNAALAFYRKESA